jgi:hypothetical protein
LRATEWRTATAADRKLLQKTGDAGETGGFVGMSPELVERVYRHHSLDFQAKSAGAFSRRSDTR